MKYASHEQNIPGAHELIKSCCGKNHDMGIHDFCCNTSSVENVSYDDDPKYVEICEWECGCITWNYNYEEEEN